MATANDCVDLTGVWLGTSTVPPGHPVLIPFVFQLDFQITQTNCDFEGSITQLNGFDAGDVSSIEGTVSGSVVSFTRHTGPLTNCDTGLEDPNLTAQFFEGTVSPDEIRVSGEVDHPTCGLFPWEMRRLDHFLFYKVKPSQGANKFVKFGPITLTDQFGAAQYNVLKPKRLGLPADKNDEGISDPDGLNGTHLKEYQIRPAEDEPQFERRDVEIANQCHAGLSLKVIKPESILVPTNKNLTSVPDAIPTNANLDHFLCYKARAKGRSKGIQVVVTDQFDAPERRYDLKKVTKLCNPVDKAGDPVFLTGPNAGQPKAITPATRQNPEAHLVCYRAKLAKKVIEQDGCGPLDPTDQGTPLVQEKHQKLSGIFVNNQFGPEELKTIKEEEFCIPSTKTVP